MIPTNKQLILFLLVLSCIMLFVARDDTTTASPVVTSSVFTHVQAESSAPTQTVTPKGKYEYLEITESCSYSFDGHCIPAYSGPGTQYDEVTDLRNGMVLKIKSKQLVNGQLWYRVYFDEWLRYPERVNGDWYIPGVAGRVVTADGAQLIASTTPKTNKRIVVDRSEHMIYAYEGNTLFLSTKISTGIESTPTPVGTFTVYKKMPSRYMQGPLPGINDNAFDLPGVPWNLYFTEDGAVIHGSYWHDRYGTEQSSGCINVPPELAKIIYDWAPLGTTVTIVR